MFSAEDASHAHANAFHQRDDSLWCEDVPLSSIADEIGTPCYVYSETAIRRRFAAFTDAFADLDARVFYSVKANHNLSLLRLIRSLGGGADVVSVGELYRAGLSGFSGPNIIFGGVGKRVDELQAALRAGVLLINVESEGELRRLNHVAMDVGKRAPVSLRVNPGVEPDTHAYTQTGHYRTKFGIALEDAPELYRLAASLDYLEPVGIDSHIGSQILSPAPYREAMLRLADLGRRIRDDGVDLRYFDIGGGYGLQHDGDGQFDLATLAEPLAEVGSDLGVTCLLEPGRWLVAPAGVLLARVLYTKRLGDKLYYVTDTGSNDFLRPSYYNAYHPIQPVRARDGSTVADIVGPVCETGDFLGRDRSVPPLEEGDLIAVGFAGAYGFVMSSNYNSRPRAAEVLVRGDDFRVIRRRETLDDLVAAERDAG
ncbi:MAG: diaminopimelate decarboxylase [Gemmatimonadales bacterium]|jgi:diaminopimelate decarboxylase